MGNPGKPDSRCHKPLRSLHFPDTNNPPAISVRNWQFQYGTGNFRSEPGLGRIVTQDSGKTWFRQEIAGSDRIWPARTGQTLSEPGVGTPRKWLYEGDLE